MRTTPVVVLALLATAPAFGGVASLNPGETVPLGGISLAEDPTLQAFEVHDLSWEFAIPDPAGEPLTGIFQTRAAVRLDTGEIDFSWRIHGLLGVTGQIESVEVTGFADWTVGADYRTDGVGDLGPSEASRSLDGETLDYSFDPTLGTFDWDGSNFFFARTDALGFALTGTATITMTNGEFVTLESWAPVVPAPATLALGGLGGLLAVRRRR